MSAAQYYNSQSQPQQYYQGEPQAARGDQYGSSNGYYPPPNGAPGPGYTAPPGPPPQSYEQQQQQPNYAMKPSAPYQPPPSQPPPNNAYAETGGLPPYKDSAPFSQATEQTGARFAPKKRLNDPIFLVLFVAAFAGFVVVSALAIKSFVDVNGLGGGLGNGTQGGTGTAVTLDYHSVYLLLMVCALALLIAVLYFMLVRAFTRIIMEVTLVLNILLNIGMCVYYFVIKYYSGAVIFLVIALLSIFFYWSVRKRIPLAKLLLQVTMDIAKHHPSVYLVAFIGLIVQAAWSVWYAFTCIAIYVKWTPGSAACTGTSCSSGKVTGLIFYATFAYYWVSQVIANVVLCTLAGGIFGGWYYYGPRMNSSGLPKRASLKAFVRATTLSLGSIAFGSLIVTILELLRMVLQAVQSYEAGQGDMIGQIVACCAVCCVSCITGLVEYFNKYAYIEISLYGKSYIPAAKDTWRLLKDRGIDALVNDSIVGSTLLWGAYLNGFLCGVFGYLYLRYTNPSYNTDGQYSAPIILFSFLIGLNLGVTVANTIEAGVSTIFVGLGEDPMILQERSPALFEEIRRNYPRVVQGVPHQG